MRHPKEITEEELFKIANIIAPGFSDRNKHQWKIIELDSEIGLKYNNYFFNFSIILWWHHGDDFGLRIACGFRDSGEEENVELYKAIAVVGFLDKIHIAYHPNFFKN